MDRNIQEIERTLAVLFGEDSVIELRCVGQRTIGGYYRNHRRLAADAATLNGKSHSPPQNVYVCANPIDPHLFARRADAYGYVGRGEGVQDSDVTCRRWLLIDIDAVRPKGVSATSEQKESATELGSKVYSWLCDRLGEDCLVAADSGNGSHILVRLPDVANDGESKRVCEQWLKLLAKQFTGDAAKVDTSTVNAARIVPLYGTVKRKGADLPEQPHRQTRMLHVPDPLRPADWAKFAALVPPAGGLPPSCNGNSKFDVEQLLADRDCEYIRDDKFVVQDGTRAIRWQLEQCPWEPEHQGSAFIIQFASGAISAGCLGDRCKGKGWQDLKAVWGLPTMAGLTAADIVLPAKHPQNAELLIVRSLDVQPEPISWLWEDRLTVGGINLLAGRGGIGKTYFTCDLVARITNDNLTAPDGLPIRHGRVLYSTGEDHIAKVIEPRMQQHEVDRGRLDYIKGVPAGEYVRLLDVIEHADLLRQALRQRPDTVALVLDPISSFQGDADSNKVAQVRRFTAVLSQLAEEHDIAILGVHHFNKGKRDYAGDSISGSHAYRDAARAIWVFALDANDPTRRLMVIDKHNWAKERPPGLAYRIHNDRIAYEAEPLDMTSQELLSQEASKPIDVAISWLLGRLSQGAQPAVDMLAAAALEDIKERTLTRAKRKLGVEAFQQEKQWWWRLPADQPATSEELTS